MLFIEARNRLYTVLNELAAAQAFHLETLVPAPCLKQPDLVRLLGNVTAHAALPVVLLTATMERGQ